MTNLWFVVVSAADVFQGKEHTIGKILEVQKKLKDPEYVRLKCNARTGHQPIGVFKKPGKATNYFHHCRSFKMERYSLVTISTELIEKEIFPIINGVKYE